MFNENLLNMIDDISENLSKFKDFYSKSFTDKKEDIEDTYENSDNFYVSIKSMASRLSHSYIEDKSFLKLCLYQNKDSLSDILKIFKKYGYGENEILFLLMEDCDIGWISGCAPKNDEEKIKELIVEQLEFLYEGVWLPEFKEYYESIYLEDMSSFSKDDIYLAYEVKKLLDRLSLNKDILILNISVVDSIPKVKFNLNHILFSVKIFSNEKNHFCFLLQDDEDLINITFYDSKNVDLVIKKLYKDIKKDGILSFDRIFSQIYEYNKTRNYINGQFDLKKEATYVLEEVIELFNIEGDSKELSRKIMDEYPLFKNSVSEDPEIIIDTFIDIMVYCFGALMKYIKFINPNYDEIRIRHLILRNFLSVTSSNLCKSKESDSFGKNIKGDFFIKPEIYTRVHDDEIPF